MGVRTLTVGCSFEREHRYCTGDCPNRPVCKTSIGYKKTALLRLEAEYRNRLCLRTRWAFRLRSWRSRGHHYSEDIVEVLGFVESELHKLEDRIALVRAQIEETEAAWQSTAA